MAVSLFGVERGTSGAEQIAVRAAELVLGYGAGATQPAVCINHIHRTELAVRFDPDLHCWRVVNLRPDLQRWHTGNVLPDCIGVLAQGHAPILQVVALQDTFCEIALTVGYDSVHIIGGLRTAGAHPKHEKRHHRQTG